MRLKLNHTALVLCFILLSSCNTKDDRIWTETKFQNWQFYKAFWINDQFFVAGTKPNDRHLFYMISADGQNWTEYQASIMGNYDTYLIDMANNQIIFNRDASNANILSITSDLVNWTDISPNIAPSCNIIYDGTKYLTCDQTINFDDCAKVSTSSDLTSWTTQNTAKENWCFRKLYYYNNKYFADIFFKGEYNTSRAYLISSDGINWQEIQQFRGRNLKINYVNNEFILSGDWGGIYTSGDGIDWKDKSIFLGPGIYCGVYFSATYFCIPGVQNMEIWSSPDFSTWKQYVYKKKSASLFNWEGLGGDIIELVSNGQILLGLTREKWPEGEYSVILTSQ